MILLERPSRTLGYTCPIATLSVLHKPGYSRLKWEPGLLEALGDWRSACGNPVGCRPRFLGLIGPVVGHESRRQDRDEIAMDGREIRTRMIIGRLPPSILWAFI